MRNEVFEFWPSDLAKLFADAGLPRKAPPAYKKRCNHLGDSAFDAALEIVSPKRKLVYTVRAHQVGKEKIAFRAVSDADAGKLYWFLNTKLIGRAEPGKTLFWTASPGEYEIRVLDDRGRYHQRRLVVTVIE